MVPADRGSSGVVIRLDGPAGDDQRAGEPVTCGIPFARSAAPANCSFALLTDNASREPLQYQVLDRWSDGSVRWVLLDFAVPLLAGAPLRLIVTAAGGEQDNREPLARCVNGGVHVLAGEMEFGIPGSPGLLRRVGDASGETAILHVAGTDGMMYKPRWHAAAIETDGALRSTVLCTGAVQIGRRMLNVTARVSVFASTPALRIDVTVHNPSRAQHPGNYWELGNPGSALFAGATLWLADVDDQPARLTLGDAVPPIVAALPLAVHQESSGGDHWNGPVHRVSDGRVPLRYRGFTVRAGESVSQGLRAEPIVTVSCNGRPVSAYFHDFWQKFPSAFHADARGGLIASLFPKDTAAPYELQGGERATRSVTVCFGRDPVGPDALAWARLPTLARAEPAQYCTSGVLPFLSGAGDPRHEALLQSMLEGAASFAAKRETADEYGWRHFGDLHADHESAFQPAAAQLVSHYNNQYDAIAGFAAQFMRTGDSRWWRLMDDLARHVADIDVYHTSEDKAAYNGGLFWHTFHYVDAGLSTHRSYPRAPGVPGGGPSAEHNYNLGLALHFWLTGWRPSRDAAVQLADWVIAMDDGRLSPFWWAARGPTGLASASGNPLYHGPGRGGGNSIKALLVGRDLTGSRAYLSKAEELLRRCINPADDLDRLALHDAERRWYYTVFLEAVLSYLQTKMQLQEIDGMCEYGRRALVHYARWMARNERPYLETPEILEYPTETWAAQDVRKSDILAYATPFAENIDRGAFLDASRRFLEYVLTALPAMPTHRYTRPMVLLLTRGYGLSWLEKSGGPTFPRAEASSSLPSPDTPFQPQKAVAFRRMRAAAIAIAALAVASAAVAVYVLRA